MKSHFLVSTLTSVFVFHKFLFCRKNNVKRSLSGGMSTLLALIYLFVCVFESHLLSGSLQPQTAVTNKKGKCMPFGTSALLLRNKGEHFVKRKSSIDQVPGLHKLHRGFRVGVQFRILDRYKQQLIAQMFSFAKKR